MADDQDSAPFASGDFLHLTEALSLKLGIADCQHLVYDEYVGFEMRCDGEREPHIHPRRIVLHRRVEKLLDLGKCDNLIELAPNFCATHAENSAVQMNVLPPSKLGMKAGSDLKKTRDASS